jgi:hypothetical protein
MMTAKAEAGLVKTVTAWVKTITHDLQKPAAIVLGFLTALGVTPAPEGRQVGTGILLGYAALVHVVETVKGTSTGNGA